MSTVAAISTPNAAGGIGIIRISGENAIEIAAKCFHPFSGKKVTDMTGYTAAYGKIMSPGEELDDGVLLIYRAPKSYTGEDVAEICCHGGLYITQQVLRTVLSLGAEAAPAGEFTKRAFLNGKLDLTEAEAVMNVISAQGKQALSAARNTLKGDVSRKIAAIAAELVASAAALAAWADYPDDDIPAVRDDELREVFTSQIDNLNKLIRRYDCGKALTEGVNTVICGKPNVGKSTLMNLLSGYRRSIVTPVAGTTRDIVEETVRIGDIILRLADTAGLHETSDEVESIGVNIAKDKITDADLILAVFDVSRPLTQEDYDLLNLCKDKKAVAVINKDDLTKEFSSDEIMKYIPDCVSVSAKYEPTSEFLEATLIRALGTDETDSSQEMLACARQRECCVKAADCLSEALSALNSGMTADAVNVSLDCAISELYTLTGQKAGEEIVNEVFSRFCVGK